MRALIVIASASLLPGCMAPALLKQDTPPPIVQPLPAASTEPGAIYASSGGMALFEDNKARNIGDLITVLLVESTQAKKSAATTSSKDQDSTLGDARLFGHNLNLDSGLSSSRSFGGKGDSSQSNSLSGSLTATVVQRYANGNLLIRGEKLLQLNQGSEVLRVEGIVRAADVSTGNTVSSDRVANARVTYAGRGALADANAQGWVSRFFNSPWMPF